MQAEHEEETHRIQEHARDTLSKTQSAHMRAIETIRRDVEAERCKGEENLQNLRQTHSRQVFIV